MSNIMETHEDEKLAPPAYGDPYDSETPAPPLTPKRRPSESSTERSMYDEAFASAGTASGSASSSSSTANARAFHFYAEGGLHRNLSICTKNAAGQSVASYYAEASEFQPNKPDVLLHQGPGAEGPVVGAARFRWTRTLHLCLGDPKGANAHQWEEMTTKSLLHHGKYELRISRPHGSGSGSGSGSEGKVQHLVWERTHEGADGVEGTGKASFQNFRIVDQATGQTLAVYLRNRLKSWKKHGKLVFHAPADPDLERWIILGCAGLAEKARRRAARRSQAGAGSGGGGGGGS